jgi:hypothetical protein
MKFFFVFLISMTAQAFPEMIRHHYVNCSACHVNNSGGGLLTAYGRSISAELLSTWGSEQEARAYYMVNPEKFGSWLNIGGDVRTLQLQQENSQFKSGRNIFMEANIKAAATIKSATAYVSLGQVKQSNQSLELKPAQYFLSYQFTDEWSMRAGRYVPIFGLNIPQHNYLVRRNLNLGPGAERDAVDLQYNGENYNLVLGAAKSLVDSSVGAEEVSINLQLQKNINDQHKIGLSYWYGEAKDYKKLVLGVHGVLGWTEKFYSLVELNHQWKTDNLDVEKKSVNELLKLGYELEKGFHLQIIQEGASSSTDDVRNYGVGAIWYPRPHFEFEGLYTKRMSEASSFGVEDYIYGMAHFYF